MACSPHSGSPGPACGEAFLGDAAAPVEMDLLALGASETAVPLNDGDSIALVFPPQGGRVVFAGVRARNLDPCGVELSGALRDPPSNEVRVDVRTVNLAADDAGAGVTSDTNISSFANVPVCPNQWSSRDAFGVPYELTVSVKDRGGRTASQTIHVTPTCAQSMNAAECACECAHGYVLGQPCDAGTE